MRYFFDSFDGEEWTGDNVGVEAVDFEAARELAQSALADMVRDVLPNGRHLDMAVRIRLRTEALGLVKLVVDDVADED